MTKHYLAYTIMLASLSGCGGGPAVEIQSPQAQKQVIIATLGDSETAGQVGTSYGSTLQPESSYPTKLQYLLGGKAKVYNFGVPSKDIVQVYNEQLPQALKVNPDVLIISTTLNDAYHNIDKGKVLETYKLISTKLPNARIVLLTPLRGITDTSYSSLVFESKLEVFDIAKYQTPDWYCGYVDIHPCEYGYSEIARLIKLKVIDAN
jgi:hypothetical protein